MIRSFPPSLPVLLILAFILPGRVEAFTGQVIDAPSGTPVAGANVTVDDRMVTTDEKGVFDIDIGRDQTLIRVRAIGHGRTDVLIDPEQEDRGPLRVALPPVTPKALYLSTFGATSRTLRDGALSLADSTEINALVIDVKGDRGLLLRHEGGAPAGTENLDRVAFANDLRKAVEPLKSRKLYLIARIVVFKDDPLARLKPEWAVKTPHHDIWRDREGMAWIDPLQTAAWEYDFAIAEAAAAAGFDEIQFDYVRFPDAPGLIFSAPLTQASRIDAIGGFLSTARRRLRPFNVFVAADIFGYVCWNTNDTFIGQRLENLMTTVDYISPMLYPSGYKFGIPGYAQPVAFPYEIAHLSLERAKQRTHLPGTRFRPWLQAFRDYAFDRRWFEAPEIAAQIRAATDSGTDGWMLWNPRNAYTNAGLGPK